MKWPRLINRIVASQKHHRKWKDFFFFNQIRFLKTSNWLEYEWKFKRFSFSLQLFFLSTLSNTQSCPALTHSHVWKGRVLRLQRTVTSQIRHRNADLQPGDRTMEWAIYGWLLTTLAFRPLYWKQVFYESACCLFPTTFIVRNLPLRKVLKKKSSNTMEKKF